MESSIHFRVNIYCTKHVKRFGFIPTESKKLFVDASLFSFTKSIEELKEEVQHTYLTNNIEEGWFTTIEF
jgi:hypothetical protein